ncbi:uncharacterized protein PV07_08655 [Cladophialophora immunda]|uniref:Uncharacterized protein n=1 Tax=Cladophialophora immunda TaxID=569365 RepID=A0A0D2CPM2_9EURO|nr:uncharacterized protein PV07_08655 [Cladophialophora immunda]KIW25489.1 hypothetical protein PV07_08655 [Cladophialophora immunda]
MSDAPLPPPDKVKRPSLKLKFPRLQTPTANIISSPMKKIEYYPKNSVCGDKIAEQRELLKQTTNAILKKKLARNIQDLEDDVAIWKKKLARKIENLEDEIGVLQGQHPPFPRPALRVRMEVDQGEGAESWRREVPETQVRAWLASAGMLDWVPYQVLTYSILRAMEYAKAKDLLFWCSRSDPIRQVQNHFDEHLWISDLVAQQQDHVKKLVAEVEMEREARDKRQSKVYIIQTNSWDIEREALLSRSSVSLPRTRRVDHFVSHTGLKIDPCQRFGDGTTSVPNPSGDGAFENIETGEPSVKKSQTARSAPNPGVSLHGNRRPEAVKPSSSRPPTQLPEIKLQGRYGRDTAPSRGQNILEVATSHRRCGYLSTTPASLPAMGPGRFFGGL